MNDTFLTAVFSHISRPTSPTFAWVVTTLMTPGGTPARLASYVKQSLDERRVFGKTTNTPTSTSASAEKGVSGGGLITAVHPAASAAPSFRVIIADGKFHGVKIDLGCDVSALQ